MIISVSILLLVIGAIVFKRWYNSAEQKGKRGEAKVHGILATLPDDYYLLDDVVLATDRGTTQIDQVVVSRYILRSNSKRNNSIVAEARTDFVTFFAELVGRLGIQGGLGAILDTKTNAVCRCGLR